MSEHASNCGCPACVAAHGPVGGLTDHPPASDEICFSPEQIRDGDRVTIGGKTCRWVETPPKEPERCVWTRDEDNSRYFHCGGGCFEFSHGETEPAFQWCPYCSRAIDWREEEPASAEIAGEGGQ